MGKHTGGYTAVSNELLEKIYSLKLNGTQFKIIMFIIRYTYGYNCAENRFSLKFIANGIKCSERGVSRELTNLTGSNILIVDPQFRLMKINEDTDSWNMNCDEHDEKNEQSFVDTDKSVYGKDEQSFVGTDKSVYGKDEQSFGGTDKSVCEKDEQPVYGNMEQSVYHINKTINKTLNKTVENIYPHKLAEAILSWIDYKVMPESEGNSFLKLIDINREKYGDNAIAELIYESQSRGWRNIYWERLERKQNTSAGGYEILKTEGECEDLFEHTLRLLGERDSNQNIFHDNYNLG